MLIVFEISAPMSLGFSLIPDFFTQTEFVLFLIIPIAYGIALGFLFTPKDFMVPLYIQTITEIIYTLMVVNNDLRYTAIGLFRPLAYVNLAISGLVSIVILGLVTGIGQSLIVRWVIGVNLDGELDRKTYTVPFPFDDV
jgi:hypothetical protein